MPMMNANSTSDGSRVELNALGLGALRSRTTPLGSYRRLVKLARLERADLSVLVVYAIAIGIVSLAVPVAAQSFVNSLAFTARIQPVVVLSILVLVGLTLAGVLRTLQHRVIETLQQRFMVRTTHEVVARLRTADMSAFSDRSAPELVNRFFDAALIQKAASTLLTDGLSALLQGAVSLVLLAFYHPALLAFDFILCVFIGIVLFGMGRNGVPTAIKESKAKYAIAAWLEEVSGAVRTFKGMPAGSFAMNKADELAATYVKARQKHFKVVMFQIVSSYALQAIATSVLLGLGGLLIIEGQLSLGQLVAAELVVTGVLSSVAKFGKYLESYYDLAASIDKIGAIIDLPVERTVRTRRTVPEGPAELRVVDVSFSYDGKASAVDDVSFDVHAGERIAVLAGEATGKSTLVDILYGLRSPSSGQVLLDGVDIQSVSPEDLRKEVLLLGKPEIFEGSVLENLTMGHTDFEAGDVSNSLAIVGLSKEIGELPEGADTRLGYGGKRLTSSQAARLTLARGLIAMPRLLIIDGTLDTLGAETAEQVLRGIKKARTDSTLIVMTSREDLAAHFPKVVTLKRSATHAEAR
jgi:putative ABC transport system ATP-binding protein